MVGDSRSVRRRDGRGSALALALLASGQLLGCHDEPGAPEEEVDPGPRLYLSVASGAVEDVSSTRLTIFDLSDPDAPRAATVLEVGPQGRVAVLRQASSPSGRYSLAQRVRDVESFDPWAYELHLLDFEDDPLGSPYQLSLQPIGAYAGWSDDESMMYVVGWGQGQGLWTLEMNDGEPGTPASIPVELPLFDTNIHSLRWAPGAERLFFVAEGGPEPRYHQFVATFEDGWPVSVDELGMTRGRYSKLLWTDAQGHVLVGIGEGCDLVSYDLELGITGRTVEFPKITGMCEGWTHVKDDGPRTWLVYSEYVEGFEPLRWIALEHVSYGFELGGVIETDVDNYASLTVAGDRVYLRSWVFETGEEQLMHIGVGEAQAQVFATIPPGFTVSSMRLNREHTRLAVAGWAGVLMFELGPDGPGPAVLASPLGGNSWSWSLHHDRFVQSLWTDTEGGHVRVIDFAERPLYFVDLLSIAPNLAIPSPIDSRVFVHDGLELFIGHPETPTLRTQLAEPNAPVIREFMLHVPGVGIYEQ